MSDGVFVEIELDYFSGKLDNLEKTPTNSKFDVTQFKRKNKSSYHNLNLTF